MTFTNSLPLHSSTRTAVSMNMDPDTGVRTQVLSTSRLELEWCGAELRVRFAGSRVLLDAYRQARTRMGPAKGRD
ncbi:hypothetical protein ACN9MJ_10510 [Acidovorax facilis]|uniref:hypothetical protein n=1 Tax=Acidovorax facilis TaxID=12917 RepID=UPI003CEA290A